MVRRSLGPLEAPAELLPRPAKRPLSTSVSSVSSVSSVTSVTSVTFVSFVSFVSFFPTLIYRPSYRQTLTFAACVG